MRFTIEPREGYGWEISANPPPREAELLREFERAHKRLPRCNSG